ncbi:di-trans,poly-cis-decaprenylcistransferase [Candidatus Uhrbacteria bacterium]|nr:di-trans,poly-cis-decaprenylcistransferase [Candidatus Uhrbacteria bacterium]
MPTAPLEHLAIIMDGNRRWAKEQNLPSVQGHLAGYDRLKQVGDWCLDRGIKILTVFAFSTENWKRAEEEVGFLMDLLERALTVDLKTFQEKNVRLRVIGRRDGLRSSVLRAISAAEETTKDNTRATFVICTNYGGRLEIVDACRAAIRDGLIPEEVTEASLTARMYWPEMPTPDLIIRTSGEERTSGFLTWESAYSELYWCDKHWPAFDEAELDTALEAFAARQRRFGK